MKIIGENITVPTYKAIVAFGTCSNTTSNTYKTYTLNLLNTWYLDRSENILTIKQPGQYFLRAPFNLGQNSSSTTCTAQWRAMINGKAKITTTASTRDYASIQHELGELKIGDTFYMQLRAIDTTTTVVGYFWLMYGDL